MLVEIQSFVNWLRRRNPDARTWRDYRYDLQQFVAIVGDRPLSRADWRNPHSPGVDKRARAWYDDNVINGDLGPEGDVDPVKI